MVIILIPCLFALVRYKYVFSMCSTTITETAKLQHKVERLKDFLLLDLLRLFSFTESVVESSVDIL